GACAPRLALPGAERGAARPRQGGARRRQAAGQPRRRAARARPALMAERAAIAALYRADETARVEALIREAQLTPDQRARIATLARDLVSHARTVRVRAGGLDAFLHEFDLSTAEGVALMCLAEALLRIPDADTVDALIKDKLSGADWEKHLGRS